MEDMLTELPPPSRFFLDDLNNFAPPAAPLPSPFISLSPPNSKTTIRPALLIIAISNPSLNLLHHLSLKTLIGTLILPEILTSGNSVNPSLKDKSCNLYAINHADKSIVIANFQYSVSSERTHSIAKTLIGQQIVPERVLIFDSVQSRNYRGRISTDDTFALKLETSRERKEGPLLKRLNYFPSGSVLEGLGAALLSRCQMMNMKATLCVSWPESGGSVVQMVKDLLLKDVLVDTDVTIEADDEDESLRFGYKNHYLDSELYT
ncbi:uncharacterized protein LOC143558102 [Bidens hawaiensis]|uniref:uncharacterized protein LOC143558102 n=1 Tax=Bidens hawaiensis TaxID=980011 RepID=UPI004049E07C